MPWEVIIKAYRSEHLAKNKFDSVSEYAENFFTFLKSAASPISTTDRERYLVEGLRRATLHIIGQLGQAVPAITDQNLSTQDRAAKATAQLTAFESTIDQRPYKRDGLETAATHTLAAPPQAFRDAVTFGLHKGGIADVVDLEHLVRLACKCYFHEYESLQTPTGVVFAGYGKLEYFPSVIEYAVPGFVGSEFVFDKSEETSISNDVPSAILPFATTSAVDAFVRGVGLDVFSGVDDAYKKFAVDFARSMLQTAQAQEPANFDVEAEKSLSSFMDFWYGRSLDAHYHSLKGVIASLPVEEMTHLAETLVTLESLKERVTTPKQSVGGPIDVAVITKSEGLVWIKRKHFFDSEKNLRFVLRQRAMYQ
ncbi:hypothetical protein CJO77_11790 [Ralstonia solanacearum]|uniref:Uncharacterized protein n=2 Tax=Ralstonia solanacearum TaxID=305 RepID=A0AAD0S7V5_RALSL|nr:hypothetical protein CJO77_11790 [Ralstonia solanacearum]